METNKNNFFNLLKLVKDHDRWMDETINLIASENRLSPLINEVLKSDLGNRVAEGWIGERVFPGIAGPRLLLCIAIKPNKPLLESSNRFTNL